MRSGPSSTSWLGRPATDRGGPLASVPPPVRWCGWPRRTWRNDLELVATEVASLGDDLRTERVGAEVRACWSVPELPDDVVRLTLAETRLTVYIGAVPAPTMRTSGSRSTTSISPMRAPGSRCATPPAPTTR